MLKSSHGDAEKAEADRCKKCSRMPLLAVIGPSTCAP